MDEKRMHEWVDVVLKPWKEARDANNLSVAPPILILDACRVHQMGLVVQHVQLLGIEVIHIPGVNKPIKCGLRDRWEQWMVNGEGIVDGQAKEPSCKVVAEWLIDVYKNIPETIGMNAWKKEGYEWF